METVITQEAADTPRIVNNALQPHIGDQFDTDDGAEWHLPAQWADDDPW